MIHIQFSLRTLLALFTFASVTCAMICSPTVMGEMLSFTAAFVLLIAVVITGIVNARMRVFCIGAAIAGGGYWDLTVTNFVLKNRSDRLATSYLLDLLRTDSPYDEDPYAVAQPNNNVPFTQNPLGTRRSLLPFDVRFDFRYIYLGHSLFAIWFGLLGGCFARFIASFSHSTRK